MNITINCKNCGRVIVEDGPGWKHPETGLYACYPHSHAEPVASPFYKWWDERGDEIAEKNGKCHVAHMAWNAGENYAASRASLTHEQILEILYKGRTMVNFSHVPEVTRAIDWLRQDFRDALDKKENKKKP